MHLFFCFPFQHLFSFLFSSSFPSHPSATNHTATRSSPFISGTTNARRVFFISINSASYPDQFVHSAQLVHPFFFSPVHTHTQLLQSGSRCDYQDNFSTTTSKSAFHSATGWSRLNITALAKSPSIAKDVDVKGLQGLFLVLRLFVRFFKSRFPALNTLCSEGITNILFVNNTAPQTI